MMMIIDTLSDNLISDLICSFKEAFSFFNFSFSCNSILILLVLLFSPSSDDYNDNDNNFFTRSTP